MMYLRNHPNMGVDIRGISVATADGFPNFLSGVAEGETEPRDIDQGNLNFASSPTVNRNRISW